jgi:hypothetical protein
MLKELKKYQQKFIKLLNFLNKKEKIFVFIENNNTSK